MEESTKNKWDRRYRTSERAPETATVLRENIHLLPTSGRALDLACGLGSNALALARHGLDTAAWDQSPIAIETLFDRAKSEQLRVNTDVRDVVASPPEPDAFDVVIVAHFLERSLSKALVETLRVGGLLCYQTFIRASVDDKGPSNPAHRLGDNELLSLFVPPLRLRVYREEGTMGDTRVGFRNLALMIAQKIRPQWE